MKTEDKKVTSRQTCEHAWNVLTHFFGTSQDSDAQVEVLCVRCDECGEMAYLNVY